VSLGCGQAVEAMSRSVESGQPDVVWMTTLYERHAAKLWQYAFQRTGDRARAEDVVQETLIRAWQHLEISQDERSVGAWLLTVARNVIIDECRAPRYRNEVQSWDALGVCDSARTDDTNDALDRLLIGRALAQLSFEHVAVIRRSYYFRWTAAQIAADLQIAEGTVKSRLYYAVRALRAILEEMGVSR
jgi:RNA polymerase sigma-70 factor (ECF subfamily)